MPNQLSRTELIKLVRQLIEVAYGEAEDDYWKLRSALEANVPHPRPWEVIQGNEGHATTPEDIVDILLTYKAIELPPPDRTP